MTNLFVSYDTCSFTFFIILAAVTVTAAGSSNGAALFKLNDSATNIAEPNAEVPSTPGLIKSYSLLSTKSKVEKKSVCATVAVAFFVTLTIVVLLCRTVFLRRRRRQADEEKASQAVIKDDQVLCRLFTIDEIRTATNNFDPDLKIGEGGFGRVYKCYIDENPVAIKVSMKISMQAIRQFQTEVEMLSKLRHPHLASLIGYCNDQQHMIIVYDLMKNGTLRDHLYNTDHRPLTWKQRLEICMGAARGLVYLHGAAEHGIIHRDVKTSNILLDEDWLAKVSDFGLSRLGPESPSKSHVTTDVKGTFGYMDPSYFWTNHLTPKSDVYGFGVVLFEVLCGRPAVDMSLEDEQHSLAQWARKNVKNGTLDQIIDPNLTGEIAPQCLKVYGKIADRCLRSDRNQRPKMTKVLRDLEFALTLQEGGGGAAEEANANKCWGGGKEVVLRPKDGVVHSCPTIWQKSASHKLLLRFLSDKAGLKWAASPTSRALKVLCFTCSTSLKGRNGEGSTKKNDPLPLPL